MYDRNAVLVLTTQEYYDAFQTRAEHLTKIEANDLPSYMTLKPIIEAIDNNLMNIRDERDTRYGMLWMAKDTSTMDNGPNARIVHTLHPGSAPHFGAAAQMTNRDFENAMNTWSENNGRYKIKSNLDYALKKLILEVVHYLHYAQHYHYMRS